MAVLLLLTSPPRTLRAVGGGSAAGPSHSRHFTAAQKFGRFRSKVDIQCAALTPAKKRLLRSVWPLGAMQRLIYDVKSRRPTNNRVSMHSSKADKNDATLIESVTAPASHAKGNGKSPGQRFCYRWR
jgi:hypothetical protein